MRNHPNLKARISLYGPDWTAIKEWLEVEREYRLAKLVGSKSHDDSQKHRGAIDMIDKLLGVEKDAEIASQQG